MLERRVHDIMCTGRSASAGIGRHSSILVLSQHYFLCTFVYLVGRYVATMSCEAECADVSGAILTKMEFAVQMNCASCEQDVKQSLHGLPGIKKVSVNLSDELVIVESSLPSSEVQQRLESTGRLVVFRGYGGTGAQLPPSHHGAAVVVLKSYGQEKGSVGLARLVQATPTQCIVEATIDGLPEGKYQVNVHEYGDMSQGCQSCGEVYSAEEGTGCLATLSTDGSGRASFQTVSDHFHVWDLIGRSLVLHSPHNRVMCGIVARSAGLFQNTKKLCTCDGVTIWDEARQIKSTNDAVKSSL